MGLLCNACGLHPPFERSKKVLSGFKGVTEVKGGVEGTYFLVQFWEAGAVVRLTHRRYATAVEAAIAYAQHKREKADAAGEGEAAMKADPAESGDAQHGRSVHSRPSLEEGIGLTSAVQETYTSSPPLQRPHVQSTTRRSPLEEIVAIATAEIEVVDTSHVAYVATGVLASPTPSQSHITTFSERIAPASSRGVSQKQVQKSVRFAEAEHIQGLPTRPPSALHMKAAITADIAVSVAARSLLPRPLSELAAHIPITTPRCDAALPAPEKRPSQPKALGRMCAPVVQSLSVSACNVSNPDEVTRAASKLAALVSKVKKQVRGAQEEEVCHPARDKHRNPITLTVKAAIPPTPVEPGLSDPAHSRLSPHHTRVCSVTVLTHF